MLFDRVRLFRGLGLHGAQAAEAVDEVADLCCGGQDPGERIEQVQRRDRVEMGEDGIYPYDAEHAGAEDHDDRGDKAASQAAAGGDGAVHKGADGIGEAHDPHSVDAGGHHIRVIGKDIEERLRAQPEGRAEHGGDEEGIAQADVVALEHPILLARAPVLPHKGGAAGVERGHHIINHVIHIDGGGVAGDNGGIEGIDAYLDKEVGNGKNRVLDAGGNAQPQDPAGLTDGKGQGLEFQAAAVAQPGHMDQDQNRRHILGKDAGQRHAVRRHAADDDEEQIQNDVQDSGDHKISQRALGVAGGAEDRVAEVKDAQRRHAQCIDAEIEHRPGQQIVLRFQQLQHRRGQQQAQRGDQEPHQGAQDQRRVNAAPGILIPLRPQILGHPHVDAVAQPNQKAGEKRDQCGGGAHGAKRHGAGIFPHHGHIRHIEQHLKQLRKDQRNTEGKNVFVQ